MSARCRHRRVSHPFFSLLLFQPQVAAPFQKIFYTLPQLPLHSSEHSEGPGLASALPLFLSKRRAQTGNDGGSAATAFLTDFAQPRSSPMNRNAVIVMDPLTEWRDVLEAIKKTSVDAWESDEETVLSNRPPDQFVGAVAIAVITNPLEGRQDFAKFIPNAETLYSAGFDFVLGNTDAEAEVTSSAVPSFGGFDVYSCAQRIKLMERRHRLTVRGVVPLAETAVEYSDTLAALLGLRHHNPLGTVVARRDKGLMKEAALDAGLRTARFGRLYSAAHVRKIVESLRLTYPVVVKTPQGFSTTDVFICQDEAEAVRRAGEVLGKGVGPDCRSVEYVLLEEYLEGEEFAVNIIASPYLPDGLSMVTDMWKYGKTIAEGTAQYNSADMQDLNDKQFAPLVQYAKDVAKSVGIVYGAGHIELKATYCPITNSYVDPVMIEVGARLSGGRKSTMTRHAVPGWHPFKSLINAHCGLPICVPNCFSPNPEKLVRHIFLPYRSTGIISKVIGSDFERLQSYHSHYILAKQGDNAKLTTDITSCSAFVWLIGSKSDIDADTEEIFLTFSVEMQIKKVDSDIHRMGDATPTE